MTVETNFETPPAERSQESRSNRIAMALDAVLSGGMRVKEGLAYMLDMINRDPAGIYQAIEDTQKDI